RRSAITRLQHLDSTSICPDIFIYLYNFVATTISWRCVTRRRYRRSKTSLRPMPTGGVQIFALVLRRVYIMYSARHAHSNTRVQHQRLHAENKIRSFQETLQ